MEIFDHDCDNCEYIDTIVWQEQISDLHACFSKYGVCIVVRYGSDGPECSSQTFTYDPADIVDLLVQIPEWTRLFGVVMTSYDYWRTADFINFAKGKVAA